MKKPVKIDFNTIKQVKPPLWTTNFFLLCLTNLSISVVFQGLNTTLPLYIEQFGGSLRIAGLGITSLTLAAIISRPLTGWYVDRYGSKYFLFAGIFLFLIPTVAFIRMVPIFALVLLRFFQGIGWGMGHTSLSTSALDIIPRNRMGEGMGYFSLFNSLSFSFAPALALWVIYTYSYHQLFSGAAFLTLIALIFSLLARYPKRKPQKNTPTQFHFLEKAALKPALVVFLTTFTNSSALSFLALYTLDIGLTTAGLFFTAMSVSTLVSRPISGFIVDKTGQKGFDICVSIGGVAILIAITLLANASTSLHLIFAGFFYGLCVGFFQYVMLILSIQSVPPEKKGAANATYYTALDAGFAFGSLFWGFVAAALGYKLMFALTAIPILCALFIYYKARRGMEERSLA